MLVMLGSLKLLQLLEVSKWDGSGELSDDCGDACQLDNELLLGDIFVWRQTNFSDCSVTCGIGKASNIENSLSSVRVRWFPCGTYVNFYGLAMVAIQGLTWVNF